MYSPRLQSPRRDDSTSKFGTDTYSTSLNTEIRKTSNDYYYNKENEFHSKKNETDTTLLPPRNDKYTSNYVSKNYNDNYSSRNKNVFNPISSPIHVRIHTESILSSNEYVSIQNRCKRPAQYQGIVQWPLQLPPADMNHQPEIMCQAQEIIHCHQRHKLSVCHQLIMCQRLRNESQVRLICNALQVQLQQ